MATILPNDAVIVAARIVPREGGMFGSSPKVMVKVAGDAAEGILFEYYEDEISFRAEEFVGKTVSEGRHLKFVKDVEYLQS